MPSPLNLNGLFSRNARIRIIKLLKDDAIGPELGKKWLVLNGLVYHVTATATFVYRNIKVDNTAREILFAMAAATGTYAAPLFNASDAGNYGVNWRPTIVSDDEWLNLQGDAAVNAQITVLEWE